MDLENLDTPIQAENVEEPQNDTPIEENEEQQQDNNNGNDNVEEFDEIDYNHQKVKVPVSQRKELLQKGYNYEKVKSQADQYSKAIEKAAKLTGYDNVEGYLNAIEEAEKQQQLARYQQAGISDPKILEEIINEMPEIKEVRQAKFQAELIKQENSLKEKPFYNEIQEEVKELSKANNVDLATAYSFLLSQKLPELLKNVSGKTKQSTIADLQDQQKRGISNISNDGSVGDDVEVTNDIKEMANSIGIDPRSLAKRIFENQKNKIRR